MVDFPFSAFMDFLDLRGCWLISGFCIFPSILGIVIRKCKNFSSSARDINEKPHRAARETHVQIPALLWTSVDNLDK